MEKHDEPNVRDDNDEQTRCPDRGGENDDKTNLDVQSTTSPDLVILAPSDTGGGGNSLNLLQRNVSVESSESENGPLIEVLEGKTTPSEPEEVDADTTGDKKSLRHGRQNKPGVILLGWGNSFSLGRSEVILLHKRPVRKSKDDAKQSRSENHLHSIHEHASNPSSPPPISGGVSLNSTPRTNGWHGTDTPDGDSDSVNDDGGDTTIDSLHQLWQKAEEVMAARQERVLKVLEEFGIGELGGGGGDEGGQQEEEQIWQIVQENFCSQR